MPRRQQKAVFAKMTDDGYLAALEGAEKYKQRRAYLLKKKELSETYEDKIFQIYNNPQLTHRQKMARIANIKKEATKKLQKYQAEESHSIVAEMREENVRRFNKEYDIREVPVSGEKYIVSLKLPSVGDFKGEWVEGKPMTKKQAEAFVKSRKKLGWQTKIAVKYPDKDTSWKQLKKKHPGANPNADYDKDGVKNKEDCRPMDKKKQDVTGKLVKATGKAIVATEKAIVAYQKSRTPKARIKKAKKKLAALKRREEAEQIEAEAKAKEAEYKKAHPKKFGIF